MIACEIDGQQCRWSDLANLWGKALDPLWALNEIKAENLATANAAIWGVLYSKGWTSSNAWNVWSGTDWSFDAEPDQYILVCEIRTDGRVITVTVSGDTEGDGGPTVSASREFPQD